MAKGKKTGGRQKGVKNKHNRRAAMLSALQLNGDSPLELVLQIMRDITLPLFPHRFEAAKLALPYFHTKKPMPVEASANYKIITIIAPDPDADREPKPAIDDATIVGTPT